MYAYSRTHVNTPAYHVFLLTCVHENLPKSLYANPKCLAHIIADVYDGACASQRRAPSWVSCSALRVFSWTI